MYYFKKTALIVLSALALFIRCSNDDISIKAVPESKITSRFISLEELRQKTSDYEKFKIIEQKLTSKNQSFNGRMEYDSLYGFSIDTEKILLIEKGSYYSYTIPIKREEETEKVENIVLSFSDSGKLDTYLTTYSLTAADKQDIEDGKSVTGLENKTQVGVHFLKELLIQEVLEEAFGVVKMVTAIG